MNPEQLDVSFNDLVVRVQDLLEKLFHVCTPEDVKNKLVADLWQEARAMLEELRKRNTQVTESRIQEAVTMAVSEVEKEWELIVTPQPKDDLKAALEDVLNKKTESVLAKLCVLEAISDSERKQVVEDIGKRCVKPYGTVLERNETSTEKALKQEGDTVNAAAQLRFRELQWQSKDHPFTNRELIHMISKWIDDTLAGSKSRWDFLIFPKIFLLFDLCEQISLFSFFFNYTFQTKKTNGGFPATIFLQATLRGAAAIVHNSYLFKSVFVIYIDLTIFHIFSFKFTHLKFLRSSTCVLANLENANTKINSEVDDSLLFFRQQVLKPQIQTCVVNVAAQLREL